MYGGTPEQIRLRLRPPVSAWVSTSKWHSSQKIKKLENGEIDLQMKCPVTDTLVRWVLQIGECVRIEGPESLKSMQGKKPRNFYLINRDTK
jgi:hypothetical protein